MGADGHWLLLRVEEWERQYPDIPPEDCGLVKVVVLGVHAVAAYSDTNGINDMEYGKQSLASELRGSLSSLKYWQGKDCAFEAAKYQQAIDRIKQHADLAYSQRCLEAAEWFLAKAEDHQVWT